MSIYSTEPRDHEAHREVAILELETNEFRKLKLPDESKVNSVKYFVTERRRGEMG